MFEKQKARGEPLVISGDRRRDSMGYSAKFGAYTIFCCSLSLIIRFAVVQVLCFFAFFSPPHPHDLHVLLVTYALLYTLDMHSSDHSIISILCCFQMDNMSVTHVM